MDSSTALGPGLDGLPELLTVDEAARILRIGRSLAYQLANQFLNGETSALPVIRVGRCLRVPRWALAELIRYGRVVSDLNATVTAAVDVLVDEAAASTPAPNLRGARTSSSAQLSLAIES
jgi:hypothetical protein